MRQFIFKSSRYFKIGTLQHF